MKIKTEIQKMDSLSIQPKTKGKWFELVAVNVLAAVAVMIGFFTPLISFALAFVIMAYVQIGVYGFCLSLLQGNNPDYESIFLPIEKIFKILCLKIIVMAGMLVWGLALIVPGVIFGLNNAFSGLVLFENQQMSTKQIMALSKRLAYGKRIQILLMIFGMIALVILACSVGVGIHFLLALAFKVPLWLTILLIILPAILIIFLFALPMFEIFLAAEYEDAKSKLESPPPKKQKTSKKNVSKN